MLVSQIILLIHKDKIKIIVILLLIMNRVNVDSFLDYYFNLLINN